MPKVEPARGPFGSRLETVEALALLLFARGLIKWVRFARWRRWLGEPLTGSVPATLPQQTDRHWARVLTRAVHHFPFHSQCLDQAIALHWMLTRRGRPSQLVIATLPAAARGTADDLHAWVELGGTILLGESSNGYRELTRFGIAKFGAKFGR